MRLMIAATLTALAMVAGACGSGGSDSSDDGIPTIVTSTNIWADVVANVACGGIADVEAVIPDGVTPHDFEPSLADRGDLEDAALVVVNGAGLEEGLEDTVEAAAEAGANVYVIGEAAGASSDPHIWFDPVLVAAALPALADELVEVGLERAAVEECLSDYQAELADLDAEIEEILAVVPEDRRKLVTNHDSLDYLADRYGFEVIGVVIPASAAQAETSPAQLEELAVLIEETGVPAVFAETQHSADDAAALADRVGVEVVTLYTGSLGEAGSDADTYVAFLRTDAELIAAALASPP